MQSFCSSNVFKADFFFSFQFRNHGIFNDLLEIDETQIKTNRKAKKLAFDIYSFIWLQQTRESTKCKGSCLNKNLRSSIINVPFWWLALRLLFFFGEGKVVEKEHFITCLRNKLGKAKYLMRMGSIVFVQLKSAYESVEGKFQLTRVILFFMINKVFEWIKLLRRNSQLFCGFNILWDGQNFINFILSKK